VRGGYHAEKVAGVQVAGGRAPTQEPVRRIRPYPRAQGDGRRCRPRQHRGVRRELPEPPAPARTHTRGNSAQTWQEGRWKKPEHGTDDTRQRQGAHVSAAAARSAGPPARAAIPASKARTRSSGRRSNASTPPGPNAPPPLIKLERRLVGFLMAAGRAVTLRPGRRGAVQERRR
jgi:hypothetical protein